jgi:hypothetical protein
LIRLLRESLRRANLNFELIQIPYASERGDMREDTTQVVLLDEAWHVPHLQHEILPQVRKGEPVHRKRSIDRDEIIEALNCRRINVEEVHRSILASLRGERSHNPHFLRGRHILLSVLHEALRVLRKARCRHEFRKGFEAIDAEAGCRPHLRRRFPSTTAEHPHDLVVDARYALPDPEHGGHVRNVPSRHVHDRNLIEEAPNILPICFWAKPPNESRSRFFSVLRDDFGRVENELIVHCSTDIKEVLINQPIEGILDRI